MRLKKLSLTAFTAGNAKGILVSILLGLTIEICQASSDPNHSVPDKLSPSTPLAKENGQSPQNFGSQDFNYKFNYQKVISHRFMGAKISTQFAPVNRQGEKIALSQLATELGFDHFNWVSYVEKDPYGITNYAGQPMSTPYNDPPQDGYQYDPADRFPFYWDLVKCDRCLPRHHFQNENNVEKFQLTFHDIPADYRLQRGEAIEFITHLVGVKSYDVKLHQAEWEVLYTFRWQLTNPRPRHGQASLIEANLELSRLSPFLLQAMKREGALLPAFNPPIVTDN